MNAVRLAALFAALALAAPALRTEAREATPSPTSDPSRVVGLARGQPLAGEVLDARTKDIAGLLRCPVCQGLSVADSPAPIALDMKAQVRRMCAAGYDRDQILEYFERSYGEFVRLEPARRGVNWLVWLAPVLGFLGGSALVAWVLRAAVRGRGSVAPAPALPGPDTLPDDPALARQVLRVRELAYGWPGGRPPASSPAGWPRP